MRAVSHLLLSTHLNPQQGTAIHYQQGRYAVFHINTGQGHVDVLQQQQLRGVGRSQFCEATLMHQTRKGCWDDSKLTTTLFIRCA